MASLYTCNICNKRLHRSHFTKKTIDSGAYICKSCSDENIQCKICRKVLPTNQFTNESLNRCIYICKECNEKSKSASLNNMMNDYLNSTTYTPTNTLYIYQAPCNHLLLESYTVINKVTSPMKYHKVKYINHEDYLIGECPFTGVNKITTSLMTAYSNIIIEQLSNPTPIINEIKIDNGVVISRLIYELKNDNPSILKTLQAQHHFILRKYIHHHYQ